MRPARPLSTVAKKFVLPPESAHYTLALGTDIPYFYCVLGLLPTTRGSGAHPSNPREYVQGESPKGIGAGLRKLRWSSPRVVTLSPDPDTASTAHQLPEAEHKVPTSIIGDSAVSQDSNHDSVRDDSAPGFVGRARTVADAGFLTLQTI